MGGHTSGCHWCGEDVYVMGGAKRRKQVISGGPCRWKVQVLQAAVMRAAEWPPDGEQEQVWRWRASRRLELRVVLFPSRRRKPRVPKNICGERHKAASGSPTAQGEAVRSVKFWGQTAKTSTPLSFVFAGLSLRGRRLPKTADTCLPFRCKVHVLFLVDLWRPSKCAHFKVRTRFRLHTPQSMCSWKTGVSKHSSNNRQMEFYMWLCADDGNKSKKRKL